MTKIGFNNFLRNSLGTEKYKFNFDYIVPLPSEEFEFQCSTNLDVLMAQQRKIFDLI